MTLSQIWREFLEGMSQIAFYPSDDDFKIPGYPHKSEADALRSDLETLSRDLQKAVKDLHNSDESR